VVTVAGLLLSLVFVRDTARHMAIDQRASRRGAGESPPPLRRAFSDATYRNPALRSCSQAGLVNNLNDALAWGIVPLYLAANGARPGEIGLVTGVYPAVWGVSQIWAGHWSDSAGRKPLIVTGMLVQSGALVVLAASG